MIYKFANLHSGQSKCLHYGARSFTCKPCPYCWLPLACSDMNLKCGCNNHKSAPSSSNRKPLIVLMRTNGWNRLPTHRFTFLPGLHICRSVQILRPSLFSPVLHSSNFLTAAPIRIFFHRVRIQCLNHDIHGKCCRSYVLL